MQELPYDKKTKALLQAICCNESIECHLRWFNNQQAAEYRLSPIGLYHFQILCRLIPRPVAEMPVSPEDAPTGTVPTACENDPFAYWRQFNDIEKIEVQCVQSDKWRDNRYEGWIKYKLSGFRTLLSGFRTLAYDSPHEAENRLKEVLAMRFGSPECPKQTHPDKDFDDALGAIAKAQEVSDDFLAKSIRENMFGANAILSKWQSKFREADLCFELMDNYIAAYFKCKKHGNYSATGKTPLDAAQALDRLLNSHIHFAKNSPLIPKS